MSEQTSILKVGISGAGAKVGAAEFKGAANSIKQDAKDMLNEVKSSAKDLYDSLFSFKGLVGAIGVGSLIKDIVSTNVEFQRLEANLKTVTGSAMGAKSAFAELQKFAAATPFSLRQLTEAFTTLKLSGVDVSEKALTGFGNIASSFGRDITEIADAMQGAMVGQFRSLATFGMKVSTVGDKYVVSFKGMKYEIEKSGKALQDFVINLGNTAFAGGMENQMQTLAGMWSNVGDNLDRLKSKVGEGGLNQALSDMLTWFMKTTAGGDELAKKLGSALGDAVKLLTEGLQFVVFNFDQIAAAIKGLAIYAAVTAFLGLVRALWATAAGFEALTVAMASNPLGLIAVGISVAAAAYLEYNSRMKDAAARTASLAKETEKMVDQFKRADTSTLDNVLANATAVADEIQRTSDGLVQAGGNADELSKRLAILKGIESDSAEKILDYVAKLSIEKANAIGKQEVSVVETPADLKKQLADLKVQRAALKDQLIDAGLNASDQGKIARGEKSLTFETQHNGVAVAGMDTTQTGMKALDTYTGGDAAKQIRESAKDFVGKLADADRVMQQIDEVERKLAVKSGKISAKEAQKQINELNTSIDNMRKGLVSLEADAELSKTGLATFLQLGDSTEAQKILAFKKSYNQLTKDGTIPITIEETRRMKAATDALIDNAAALKKAQDMRGKSKSLAAEITKNQWDNFIDLKVPPGLQDIERQLVAIAAELGISKAEAEKFRSALETIAKSQADIASRKIGRDYDKQLQGLQLQLHSMGLSSIEMQKQAMLQDLLNELKDKGITYSQKELEGWTKQIDLITEAQQKINRLSAIKSFVQDNQDLMKSLADFSVTAIDLIADAWVNFTETGKFNFKDFADFVYKEITKIIIKFLVAKAIEEGISLGTGALGGGKGGALSGMAFNRSSVGHEGGPTTSLGASMMTAPGTFAHASRYALGGIPGMKPGEVPIIAHREEAIVPLPNGRGIPVELKGGQKGHGGGDTFNINIHGVKDFDSFKRNSGALASEASRMLSQRSRRDGTKKG